MPRIWRLLMATFAVMLSTVAAILVHACPYCPPTAAPLSQKLAEAKAVCVVEFLESKAGEQLSMESTSFNVLTALKGGDAYPRNKKIETNFGVTAQKGDQFLLMGKEVDGEMEWSLPDPLDELGLTVKYITNAPALEAPQLQRLEYYWKHLDSRTPLISNDAFGEFARARFEDVELLSAKLDRTAIRKWLEDPNEQLIVRRGFYGMLLGLCGNDNDADFLWKQILTIPADQSRIGIDGVMGGYVLLRGEAGLKQLLDTKVDSLPFKMDVNDPRLTDLDAVRVTLKFLWDFRHGQYSEEVLRGAMRRFLDRPQYAELAIIDLARWKDWSVLDRLIASYGKDQWSSRSSKKKIIEFALQCQKSAGSSAEGQLATQSEKAKAFLNGLDPELVKAVKEMMGGFPRS